MSLQGGKLAGGNPKNKRVENDYYATNPKSVEMLLNQCDIFGYNIYFVQYFGRLHRIHGKETKENML